MAGDRGAGGLPAGTPVVLVLGHGGDQGLVLPRTLAFRTGRDGVWAHSGRVGLVPDPASGVERIVVENRRSEGLPLGGWFRSDADDLGPHGTADEGFVTALDGTVLPDASIKTRTIGDDGRSFGRVTMSDPDLVTNEPMFEAMAEITEFAQFDPVSEGTIGEPAALLENGRPVYHFAQHGMPLRGVMEVADGRPPVQVGGEETGRYIRRRPSMRKLGPDAVIDLGSCWADASAEDLPYLTDAAEPPYVFDVLGVTSYAQGVANGSGAAVMAVDRVHVLMRAETPKAGVLAGPSGEPGARRLLLPEPGPAELAALARTAGLHTGEGPVPADVLDTTLRLVKALRRSFGADVAADGRFRTLLEGIGALENMRRADPHLRVAGPFTLHHLHLAVHARHRRTSNDPPSRDDVRRVLLDAAAKKDEAAAGRLTLHQYTPLPSLDWALKRLAGRDLAALAADVLRLPDAGAVTRTDVSRLVWGAVRGAEALRNTTDPVALAKKALHLHPSAEPTPDEAGDRLLWLMAGAAVSGFDPADPADLAAWDLVRHGALDDGTRLTAQGVPTGRDWTRRPVTGDIATEGYLLSPDGGLDAATPHPAPWPATPAGSAANAYVVHADSTNGHISMPWPDGSSRWVPGSEIAALLRHDRVHQQIALHAPLLMVGAHTNPGGLAQHVAGRAGTARTTLLSELPGALLPHPASGRNVIVLTGETAQRPDHWQPRRPAALPGASAQQGALHTFTGRALGTSSAAGAAATAPRGLSQYLLDHGRRHDGHIGLVIHEPTPATVLDGLHRRIVTALGADPDSTDGRGLLTRLQDVLSAEEVELNRPYLRSRQGYRITLRHAGRDRTVDVRLSYADPVRSAKYGQGADRRPPTLPDIGVEARAGGGQSSSHAESAGNIRTGSVPWSGIFPDDSAGALRWWDSTVNVSATHNQLTQSVTVGETFLVTSKQQAEEPAHPMDVDGRWQIQLDTPRDGDADNWLPERSHGALTIWFHEHLAFDGDDPAGLPEPGDVDDLPLWGGDSVAEPRRLLTELLRDDAFDALRSLDDDSERALENFLSQRMLQGTPHLQRDGGVFSPTLLDEDGNAVGVLELTAVIEPGRPMRRSAEGKSTLETWFSHASSVDKSAKLTSGVGVEGAGGPSFTTDHAPGHPAAGSSFGGNLMGKAAVNWQLNEQLSNVSSATLMHGLRTKSSHLLTSGRVTYTVRLHRAGGGLVSSTFGPWEDGLRLRIAQRTTMAGHRPTPAELRELPEHLENLESIGYTETPLKVDGADPLFTAAEAWLRREGFLPPDRPRHRAPAFRLDEPLVVAQLENLRRLRQMRSTFGLASSAPDAVDGGEPVWFERPNAVSGTRRVQLVFTAARDTARPAVHSRRLPDVLHIGSSSYESGGARQRGTALSGALGGGGGLNAPLAEGSWGLNTAPDYLGTRQLTDASSSAGQVGYDQLTMTTRNGSELFEVPARLGLDLYEGADDDPLVRFADTDAEGNPVRAEEAEADGDVEMQLQAASAHTVPGSVRLLVPHYRTRVPAPTPAPAPRPGHVIRQPVTDGGATDDQRRLALVDDRGRPLPGLTRLPEGALVDTFRGTTALMEALRSIVAGTYPGNPGRGRVGRAVQRASATLSGLATETARRGSAVKEALPAPLSGAVNRAGSAVNWAATPVIWAARTSTDGVAATYKWTSVAVAGASLNDRGTVAAEARQDAIRPGQLISRAQQILGGAYVVEGLTLPGMAADQVMMLEITGYLSNPRRLGSESLYSEQDVMSGDTAGRQRGVGVTHQGNLQVTALQSAPTPPDLLVHQANPGGRYSQSRRTDATGTVGSATKITHATEFSGDTLWIGNDLTLLMTVRWGVRNIAGNTVGLGAYAPVTVAVDLPRAVTYLAPAQAVAQLAAWFAGMPGVPALTPNPLDVPLPDRYARTRQLGKAIVMSVTQLDGTAQRRERRDRMRRELTALVENEAPGVVRPGHASYLPGVATEIARVTEPAALRALPGRGPGGQVRFHFLHVAYGGARLVEVALTAEPVLQTPALRGLRGRRADAGTGLEQVDTHTPQSRATTSGTTTTRQGTANLVSRYPRPGATGWTDREGPSLAVAETRARTARSEVATEDRFWTRSGSVADFTVDYRYTATVRSQVVWQWPANIPGALFQAGLLNLSGLDGDVGQRTRAWIGRLLRGRPVSRVSVPAATALRFVASEADRPRRHEGPRPPALLGRDPLLLTAADAAAEGTTPFPQGVRLETTGPTPVYDYNAAPQLTQALHDVDPRMAASWGLPANASAEALAARLAELVQAGEISLDPSRTAAGLTDRMPGSWPVESPDTAPSLRISLHNPRPVTEAGDVAIDRVRRQNRTSATTSSAAGSFVLNQQGSYSLADGNRHILGVTFPLAAQQPHALSSGGNTSAFSFSRLRTGATSDPADRRIPRTYETLVDTVIEVSGPGGVRYVTGSSTTRLWERDVLGFGVTPARPGPRVYDLPAILAAQGADDLRDWARHPVTDLPDVLADAIDADDASAELWLALGPDPDGTRLARALFVGSLTAARAGKPVELVIRTGGGLRIWPFAADGSLTDTTAATDDAWQNVADAIGVHLDAVRAEAAARYREGRLTRRQPGALAALDTAHRALDTATTAHRDADRAHTDARRAAATARTELTALRGRITEARAEIARLDTVARDARARYDDTADEERLLHARWQEARAEVARLEELVADPESDPESDPEAAPDAAPDADPEGPAGQAALNAAVERADALRDRGRALHQRRQDALDEADTAREAARELRTGLEGALGRETTLAGNLRRAEEDAAEADRVLRQADTALRRATGARDAIQDQLDGIEAELTEVREELDEQGRRHSQAWEELPALTDALDTGRRAEGLGDGPSLRGTVSSTPARPTRAGRLRGQPLPAPPPETPAPAPGPNPAPATAPATAPLPPPRPDLPAAERAALAAELAAMTEDERTSRLLPLSSADREALAADRALTARLRRTLPAEEFARTAALLTVDVPPGVDLPVSAGIEARAQVARMLRSPAVAERMLNEGARMIVVPKDAATTSLDAFGALRGETDENARSYDVLRGVEAGGLVAVGEENLLGDTTAVPGSGLYADGYSAATHEFAHALHRHGLTDEQRRLVTEAYHDKVLAGGFAAWPDGPLYDSTGTRRNYSARNEFEYFAQLTNAYLGTNTGTDPYTGRPRNNGAKWVRRHEPKLLPLLRELYGPDPKAGHPWGANPRAEDDAWAAFRALWDETGGAYEPQPHAPVPAPPAPPVPALLSRPRLTATARRIAGPAPRHGLTVPRCLVLLGALREALYPGGVRPAVTVDDAVLGGTAPASALVPGPGWSPVGAWEAVARAVAAQGPGAAAFVLARRQGDLLGHAWAAYHLGGFDGVMWLDLSARDGRHLSSAPPPVAASDARAVVVDPAGRAVEDALPAFAASSSIPHSLVDAATGRGYGALGLEIERRLVFVISGMGDVPAKQVLATAPGFSIVTDHASVTRTADGRLHLTLPPLAPGDPKPQQFGYLIGEIVVEPMAVLPGERRQSPEETLERLARVERALDARDEPGAAPQIPLADLLPAEDDWTVTALGGRALVGRTPVRTDRAYVQPTTGFPALGLSVLQDRAVDRLPKGAIGAVEASGREFAMKATADFVRAVTGRTDVPDVVVPFLAPVPDVDDLWGYLRFAYAHVVARPTGVILNQGPAAFMVKNGLAVASRPALDRVLRALRPRARDFLDRHHDGIGAGLAATLGRLLELYRRTITPDRPLFPGYFDATIGDAPSAREHTTAVLTGRTSEGKAVTQKQVVDMDDDRYPVLDTDDGRLDLPLVLTELRHFAYDGEQLMTPQEIRQAVAELSQLSREAYRRALAQRAPLPDDVLTASLNRVLDNEAVRGLAHFVQMVLMAGLPQPSGPTRRLMPVGESQRISRALGEYALGAPLPADHPLHRSLRTAVQEAADAVDTLPPPHRPRLRAMVTAAQGALEILADPERTPPPLEWASELVAMDGSRVLLDRVLVVRHRTPDGAPLGTSSRPDQEWRDARRQTYGLLPEVVGFTYVRPGPVALESPVQNLPFHDAYLVGLRGGPDAAALALDDGTDAVVDYARIVDFLFASDGHLTALAPERPVLVTGADLAGPPSADPLETPPAGQVLANGLGHWIWTTGSGIEPVLAPGDGPTGPRWQLAEGDWWAAFRPEPTTPELARWAERITGDRGRAPDVRRWVRAIRLVYGPTVDDQGAALATLLQGFWALERTRAANGVTTPLTWGDLRTAISAYFAANGQVEPPLPVALQFLLLSAAGAVGVDLELSGTAITPLHHSVRAWDTPAAGGVVEDVTDRDEEMSLFAPAPAAQPPVPAPAAPASVPASDAFTGPGDPVLDPKTRITGPSGSPQGRNWTRASVSRVLPGTLRTIETRPGAAPKVVATGPAPWPDTAYVVSADGEDGRVLLPDGRELGPEAVADALAADPELAKLPKNVPVVLAVPYTGDRYQRTLQAVADRLDRTVWGPSGAGRIVPDGSGAHVLALLDRDADAPVGDWLAVEPSTATGPYLDRTWTALDGTVFRDSDVLTVPLTDEDHRHFGRLAVEQKDGLRRRAQRLRRFRTLRELSHRLPAGTDAGTENEPVGSEPVSMDAAVYVYAGHGEPGRMHLPLRDGRTVWLEKRDAAAYIAGLPEVRKLPPGHRMHLEVCWSASDGDPRRQYPYLGETPHVDDPLEDVPLDQAVANLTRRETDGSTRQTGFNDTQRIALASATGERGRRVLRRPEPLGPALDALARDTGLHRGPDPVPPETRQTMLRLVRAVRTVFGTTFEDHRGGPDGRFERVMKGIVALERMRANDGKIAHLTPFRLDLLDFFVQEHTGRAPDPRGYVALLDFAAERIDADENAGLTDAVPAPSLETALGQLADKGEQMIRHVQSLPAPAPFTPRLIASTLWATARAARLLRPMTPAAREAMGREVLHLDAATPWDRSRQESLWALLTRTIAEGADPGDQDVLAARHLAESGAFSPPALLRQGANVQGVNWSGTAMPAGVDWGSVRQMVFGPQGSSIRPVPPAWTGPHKPMPMLNVVEVDGAGRIVLHLPGRAPLPVTENAFLALLESDPALRTLPLKHPVLFLTTGPGALSPQLVQRFSRRTGRPAYGYSAPMMLSSGDPAAPLAILALTDPATRAPGVWTRAARQTGAAPAASGTGDLTVFSPSDRKAGRLPDLASLSIGGQDGPPAGSLLSPGTLMTNASGAPRGRNLTDQKVRRLRIGRVRVYEERPGTPPQEKAGADEAAPWGDSAYVVWGESGPDGVRFPGGHALDAEKLAAELAADPELAKLPGDVPVVLAVPYLANQRYLAYLRAVANLLERPVWAPSGDGRLVRDKKREHVPALIDHGPDQPLGSWVPFRPTKAVAPLPDRAWTALDGTVFRDGDVLTRPLVSDRNERFGRMSHADDVRGREELMRSYQRAGKQVHLMASGGRTALIGEEPRTPDPAAYVYVAHGLPGGLQLALGDGRTVWLGAADGGRYIGGLPEVAELPEGHRMKLEVCWSDAAGNPALPQLDNRPAPAVQDPLEEVPLAQHTANVSRRVTEGALMSSGFHTDAHILHDAPGGVVGRRRWVVPEPLPHELDEMARTAGLHTDDGEAPPQVRATTLRLVRALRLVFGPEAEQDKALHARLLRGIGAMETLRANDAALSRFTPFRMELWTFVAQRAAGRNPGPDDYRKVLDLAAGLLERKPEAALGEAIGDPAIQHAVRQVTQFGEPLVRNVLRQPENVPVTKRAVTRAFWAMAGAARQMAGRDDAFTEKLGRRVLHLFPDEEWAPARKQQLYTLTAQAVAAGLDPADFFTLAAFQLASRGAFGPAHHLRAGEAFQGFNWSGGPAPAGLDLRVVGRQDTGDDGAPLQHFRAPWAAEGEPGDAMVVWTDTDAEGFVVLHLPGMRPLRVADREFLALLDLAPPLRTVALAVPVLFVLSGAGSGAGRAATLSEAFSDRTARNGWSYGGALTVAPTTPPPDGAPAPLRLIGRPGTAGGRQGVWHKAWLRGLNSSVLVPAPYGDALFSSPKPPARPASVPDTAPPTAPAAPSSTALTAPRSLTGVEAPVPPPLSRAELTALVPRVTGREPLRGLTAERCLVLLGALRGELFPRGVRPAGTVDDSVIGVPVAETSLVAGPGWRRVRSWDAVAGAVAAQGPGAAAFVLARRQGAATGHAWAAYHPGGRGGVVWVDLAAGHGRQVSSLPPAVAASDARAVVVGPAGQALAHALPEFSPSSSTALAGLDAAVEPGYGAIGLEVEERRDLFLDIPGRLTSTLVLAHGPGITLVTDSRGFWMTADGLLHVDEPRVAPGEPRPVRRNFVIGEFVLDPMAVLPGERRQSQEEGMAQLQRARAVGRLPDERRAAVPLTEMLGPLGGWTFTETGLKTAVNPAPEGFDRTAYGQLTLGYPTVGLRELQDIAHQRLTVPKFETAIAGARSFGQSLITTYANHILGTPAVESHIAPFLAAIPEIDEVWGYGWLGFQNVVAAPIGDVFDHARPPGADPELIKNLLPAASRNALDRILRALRPRARAFLDERHDQLSAEAAEQLGRLLEFFRHRLAPHLPADPAFFDTAGTEVPTPREHWTAVLTGRTSEGEAISQRYAVGMDDGDYPTLDTDDGRLAVPLVLAELRHFGYTGQFMTPEEIQRAVTELSALSRAAYERALGSRAPLPDDVLRESVRRITDNPVVQGVAGFLVVAARAGIPQAGGPTRRPLTEWDGRAVALALGAYALGRPLPADHPAHLALRAALVEAYELLPNIPPGGRTRAREIFDAARGALAVLADPAQTPPVLPWYAEVVAMDGSRVLLDRVMAVRHRDARETPVGTSSLPLHAWQDGLRQTYGLLPEVVGFTYVRSGPVALESPVQSLPFQDAYLVGLRGGPGGALLALTDGTDAAFDYARIVDFLYAVDGDLTALAPERPVVVTGADLAGPPPFDPLETPPAGQILANGLDRWVWTTGSGAEAFLVAADHLGGPRWQLAEGDWWAGFRPELSSAERGRWAERVTGDRGRAPDVRRWVRAIRLVYGPLLENDANAFEALLQGFWALERTRAANGVTTPLTWGDLRTAISAYFAANGQVEPPLPVALQFLLLSAAGAAGIDLELSGKAITPLHHSVRAWDTPAAGPAGPAFFAPAGTAPTAPATAPAAASTTAAPPPASGTFTGPNDPLLAPKTLLTGPSGDAQGRDWTGRSVSRVLPATLRTIETRPGAAPKVVATGPAPWPDT
ncbi:lonely Cys domain-containing protein, partial [Streptomyces sp. NPDC059425]|uniref:lonely Cys domain-containing protein n=1 Tax=Streptomyces sp. NPDC059425 TaxID=3346826 RepID=UPI0036AE1748